MPTLIERLKSEPAVVVSTIVAALALVGVTVSETNADLVTQLIVVLVPLIGGFITRSQVTPVNDYTDIETEGHPGNPLG